MDVQAREEQVEPLLAEVDRLHESIGVKHRRLVFDAGSAASGASRLARAGHARHGPSRPRRRCLVDGGRARRWTPRSCDPQARRSRVTTPMSRARTPSSSCSPHMSRGRRDTRSAASRRWWTARSPRTAGSTRTARPLRSRTSAPCRVSQAGVLPRGGHHRTRSGDAIHELTFLLADEDDWPKNWYERIGFERVGLMREALLEPSARP